MDVTTATPVEIDTALAALYERQYAADMQADRQVQEIQEWVSREINPHASRFGRSKATWDQVEEYLAGEPTGYNADCIRRMRVSLEEKQVAANAAREEMVPFHAEWNARGGWTRAFLVTNNGGHVHRSMSCSTCYDTTHFNWLPNYSGKDEAEIVSDAGERACTVCYPSAPVEVLQRATKIFSEDEKEKQARAAEREAKRNEKAAAEITVADWTEYDSAKYVGKVFKTERAVTNAIAGALSDLAWYGVSHPSATRWLRNVESARNALEDKGIEYDYDKALAAARKKVTREGGEVKF